MDPFEPQLDIKKAVQFAEGIIETQSKDPEENLGDIFGGFIKFGQWNWLTKGSRLCITSSRTGQIISKFEFGESNGFGMCIITCLSEIELPYLNESMIAIGIQYADCPGGLVVIYSIEESTVIRCIELMHKITCCKFIGYEVSQHTVLQNMNGCLAVGTDSGSVLLVDLNLRQNELAIEPNVSVVPCHIVDYSMNLLHLHRHFQHCQQEGVHFGIQLEVLENSAFVQSLLPINLILGLAVGLADGRLVLYDLTDMQVFYVAPSHEKGSPLVKIDYMEPPDDPRSCVYIWAFHEHYQNSMAVMHSLMYEKRVVTSSGFSYFENFQVSNIRLQLPLNCPKIVPITCQAISKAPSHGNEEVISLCALVWKQDQESQTEVLLFDINQWYKEEMPYIGDWREEPSYLASFLLPDFSCIEMYFDTNTISLFNSVQRPEEHFYPISLSFDSIALGEKNCLHLNWPGLQNKVINTLRTRGSLALLDPNQIFHQVLNARLLPQFSGLNYKATFSLKAKRETLLSVAIEHNCIGLLKECAKNWSDGSHQGSCLNEGVSLSTFTDWLWARASSIKERCNSLCKVLFDHSGYSLDQHEKKELGHISKQLKTLGDLLNDVILKFGENIPSDVLSTLESQAKSIRMASEYQEILLWLLNIGLLPEGSRVTRHREIGLNLVPYPYESLRNFYENRRKEFLRYSSRKNRSCDLIFIDSFIDHTFKSNSLRDNWQESGGDGLYPPASIQAMLRTMLIPDVNFENKCALFLYFFLDLNMAIEDKQYEQVVQNFIKFPSVFKLSASLIKQIQAFWNLDHCHFQAAVDELISPFNKDLICPQWQIELFISALLNQVEPNLALRVLEAKSFPISPLLQLNTYLANDLISEAFHFVRLEKDEDLLKLFFTRCLLMKKFGVIRDLALTDHESNLVQSLLKNNKNRSADDLSFVFLLQKYKYIEAVTYQDEISKGREVQRAVDDISKGRNNQSSLDINTPALVLAAYNTTLTPVTKNLSDVYLKIKNKIKTKETEQESPYPLSCQLIKQNANDLLGGIYHSSALSTHFASHYWDLNGVEGNPLKQSTNAPFLRSPQISLTYSEYNPNDVVSYPEPYKAAQKRRLDNSFPEEEKTNKIKENPKKRRKIYNQYGLENPPTDILLTHFKNSSSFTQELCNLTKKLIKTPPRESSFFLETPYVKNSNEENSSRRDSEKQGSLLPGILKSSNSNPLPLVDEVDLVKTKSIESEKKERKDTDDEKSIRFILPQEDESEENISEHDVSIEGENVSKTSPELQYSQRNFTGPLKRKSLRNFDYKSYVPIRKPEQAAMFATKYEFSAKKDLELSSEKVPHKESELIAKDKSSDETPLGSVKETSFIADSFKEKITPESENNDSFYVTANDMENVMSSVTEKEEQDVKILDKSQFEVHTDVNVNLSKRGRSESSDDQSRDFVHKRKVKGRNPIHSSEKEFQSTTTQSILHPTLTILRTGAISDFQPHISSSKVCATESKFNEDFVEISKSNAELKFQSEIVTEKTISKVTFSERSTVLGGLTTTYLPTMETTENVSESVSITLQPKEQMLDTTVGMTLYDTMGLTDSNLHRLDKSRDSTDTFSDNGDEKRSETSNKDTNKENFKSDDNSQSVILLSSRSSGQEEFDEEDSSEYDSNLSYSKCIELEEEQSEEEENESIEILDEDSKHTFSEEEEEEGSEVENESVEILDEYNEYLKDGNDSYSDNFSEVTRTSTCSSLPQSNQGTYSSGTVEFEEESVNSISLLKEAPSQISEENKQLVSENTSVSVDLTKNVESAKETEPKKDSAKTEPNSLTEQEEKIAGNVELETTVKDSENVIIIDEQNQLQNQEVKIQEHEVENPFKIEDVPIKIVHLKEGLTKNINLIEKKPLDEEIETEKVLHLKEGLNKNSSLIEEEPLDKEMGTEKVVVLEKQTDQNEFRVEALEKDLPDKTDPLKGQNLKVDSQTDETNLQLNVKESNDKSVFSEKTVQHNETGSDNEMNVSTVSVTEIQKQNVIVENSILEIPEEKINKTIPETEERQTETNKQTEEKDKEEHKTKLENPIIVVSEIETEEKQKNTVENEDFETEHKSQTVEEITEPIHMSNKEKSNEEKTQKDKVKEQITEAEVTPLGGRRRSKSFSRNLLDEKVETASPRTRNLSRGGSMPPTTGNQIVTRRRSILLETLDENATPDSPSSRTRSKLRSESIDPEIESPSVTKIRRSRRSSVSSMTSTDHGQQQPLHLEMQDGKDNLTSPSRHMRLRSDSIDADADDSFVSNSKRTRLSSISSMTSTDNPQTPKGRRRISMSMDKELSNTPKETGTPRTTRARSVTADVAYTPVKTPRRLSISKNVNLSPDQPATPISKHKKNESEEDKQSPKAEPEILQGDDYKTSRRLTRTQLAVMEKSAALAKQFTMSPVIRKRRASNTTEKDSQSAAEDNESQSSRISHLSNSTTSRRITRSSALKDNTADEILSIASSNESGRKKRKRGKDQNSPSISLSAIPEEEPSGSEKSVSKRDTKKSTRVKK